MTSDPRHPQHPSEELLDRLLDGDLPEPERLALERQIERDPSIRADHEELRSVDDALRRAFGPSRASSVAPPPIVETPSVRKRFLWPAVAAAAVLALAAVAAWFVLRPVDTSWTPRMVALYRTQERSGFTPAEVCTSAGEFMLWTRRAFQEPLSPVYNAPGIEWVGWNREQTFSNYTGVLLAKVDGKPVVVVMDRDAPSRTPRAGVVEGDLHVFARKIGGVSAIEITPLLSPRVLDALRVP